MMVDSEPTGRTDGQPAQATTKPGRKRYRQGPVEDNAGWTIFSYLISGMVVYGLIGWLVAGLTHIAVLLPLGAIFGLVVAIVLIVLKYGRP